MRIYWYLCKVMDMLMMDPHIFRHRFDLILVYVLLYCIFIIRSRSFSERTVTNFRLNLQSECDFGWKTTVKWFTQQLSINLDRFDKCRDSTWRKQDLHFFKIPLDHEFCDEPFLIFSIELFFWHIFSFRLRFVIMWKWKNDEVSDSD